MGDKTGIEYLDATWGPIKGCSHKSSGCVNCWAERQAARFNNPGDFFHGLTAGAQWTGNAQFYEHELYKPIRWKRPRRIGVCFMGDLFHETVHFEWIAKVFAVMAYAKQHTFLVLTKRPQRMAEFLDWAGSRVCPVLCLFDYIEDDVKIKTENITPWPIPNVWLGVSVEDQLNASMRIPILLRVPAALRYVSAEPLIGRINLRHLDVDAVGDPEWCQIDALAGRQTDMGRPCPDLSSKLDWVICGGESGRCARPMHPKWALDLRDQCKETGVPFYFKQFGEWISDSEYTHIVNARGYIGPDIAKARFQSLDVNGRTSDFDPGPKDFVNSECVYLLGKAKTGHVLDGQVYNELPVVGGK